MTDKLIGIALKQRFVTILMLVLLIVAGIWSFTALPMDSFPDVSNVQVQIITEPESMATEEVESLVTIPVETAMSGLPGVQTIRSNSSFGLSVVTVIFNDNLDIYFARQLVQQRLGNVELPEESPRPMLGPVVSTFSNMLMYYVDGPMNATDLRTLQDWVIARRLRTVPGVANVVTYGGFVRQYQVLIDPAKMRAFDITLKEVVDALHENNANAGGNFLDQAGEETIIRGIGRIQSTDDIANIMLRESKGTPTKLGQIATIEIGGAFRRGSASMNGQGECVTGIVMSQKSANTKQVAHAVEECLQKLQKELPPGVRIVTYYNQMELVDKTMDTVREILLFSAALVLVVLTAILLNIRAAIIAALVIPLSLLFSFIMMKMSGLSSNLMTLGAVDFGVIVDAGVVMVENVFRQASDAAHARGKELTKTELSKVCLRAAREVGKPILFAILIIIAVYIPLFTLEGVEGKMFRPLALTFIYALLGALLCAMTFIPLFCAYGFQGKMQEKHNPVLERVIASYRSALRFFLDRPKTIIGGALIGLIAACALVPFLGSEFIPTLDEGSILLRTKLAPNVAHTQAIEVMRVVEEIAKRHPEVSVAVSRIGRSGMGSDLEGVDNADIYIGLTPHDKWTVSNKDELISRMAHELDQIPGLTYSFSQPIADMVDDLVSGVKADLAIKIFGDDLHTLNKLGEEVKHTIRPIRGCADLHREHLLGQSELDIKLDRNAIARYGLNVSTVLDYVHTALAGRVVTTVFEGSRRFGVAVRFPLVRRDTLDDISNMMIATPDGARVPLKTLAHLDVADGTVAINRENGERRTAVLANIRGRDLGGFVMDAKQQVEKSIKLPQGYRIEWGGQFENQMRAMTRLAIVVPIVLLLIFVLLMGAFGSFKNALLVILNVPFAIIGGIIALFLSGQPMSVPAIIGFIALFGVAVQNGVILVSYIQQLVKEGYPLESAIEHGGIVRVRPVLMTAMVAIVGLLPKLFSHGTGAEIQRPLATVVLGGLVSATLLTLLMLPVCYKLVHKGKQDDDSPLPGERTPTVAELG